VYSPPAYTPPAQTVPVQNVAPPAATPVTRSRPTVVHRPAAHKARHRARKRHVVVHHKPKPAVVRLTPRADAYVTSVVKTMSAAVVAPSVDGTMHRRRAGLALAFLCIASSSLLLLGRRLTRASSTT
jgi:hypothetical protein